MRVLFVFVSMMLLYGCVGTPQLPVALDKISLNDSKNKVGVVLQTLPSPTLYLPGADCLLCYAVAKVANSSLGTHAKTLIPAEFSLVKSELIKKLRMKGVDVVAIEADIDFKALPKLTSDVPNTAKYDFANLKSQYGITQLLVIDINAIGFERPYASYIPTGDPNAIIRGTAYMVDLTNNAYKWYKPISLIKSAEGDWKEPPTYPGLTNAYFSLIEEGRESILSEF